MSEVTLSLTKAKRHDIRGTEMAGRKSDSMPIKLLYLLYIDYMAFLILGEKPLRPVFPQLLVIILVHKCHF